IIRLNARPLAKPQDAKDVKQGEQGQQQPGQADAKDFKADAKDFKADVKDFKADAKDVKVSPFEWYFDALREDVPYHLKRLKDEDDGIYFKRIRAALQKVSPGVKVENDHVIIAIRIINEKKKDDKKTADNFSMTYEKEHGDAHFGKRGSSTWTDKPGVV